MTQLPVRPAPNSRVRILVVGEDHDAARALARRLADVGYEATALRSIDAGSDTGPDAAATAPAVLIVDVPRGGLSAAVEASIRWRGDTSVPVIFLIDETEEADAAVAAPVQPHGIVLKPFRESELLANVELALARRGTIDAVREAEQRFFDTSIDLLCFLGFDGRFRRLNPAWERTLGFSREELMSRPFIEFVHPDDRERTLAQNRGVRSGGQARAFENRYLCSDGSYRWLRWNAAPDMSSQLIYSAARDVTEAREAEEERERLVARLQAALDEVRTLRSILPICSYCRKIRDDDNGWHSVETYISRHTDTQFSHGICPSCMASVESSFDDDTS